MVNDEQSEEEEKEKEEEGMKRNSNWVWHVEMFTVFAIACRYIHI